MAAARRGFGGRERELVSRLQILRCETGERGKGVKRSFPLPRDDGSGIPERDAHCPSQDGYPTAIALSLEK